MRRLEIRPQQAVEDSCGGVQVEVPEGAKVFEVKADTKLLIMVLKSDDVSMEDLSTAQTRLRSQLQRHGIDGILFAVSTQDDIAIYEETT